MARPLSELQAEMKAIAGVEDAYIQAPTSMVYPCIMIERDSSDAKLADNIKYYLKKRYTITVIDRAPDSPIPDIVEGLQLCRFDRYFRTDGLNHFVFQLYF